MAVLSSRTTASSGDNGFYHIIKPDALSPTGYTSYKILDSVLKAVLNLQISNNNVDIAANQAAILALQNTGTRSKHVNQVSDFTFAQPADSRIERIVLKSTASATFSIGTSITGSELYDGTLTSEYNYLAEIEKPIKDFYSSSARTIYFTITGTISATIYYTLNEFN